MKKLLSIITLVLSSFFILFANVNNVKAEEDYIISSLYLNKDISLNEIYNDILKSFPDINLEEYKYITITNSKYSFAVNILKDSNFSLTYVNSSGTDFVTQPDYYTPKYYMSYNRDGTISSDFGINRGYQLSTGCFTNFDISDKNNKTTSENLAKINSQINVLKFPPKQEPEDIHIDEKESISNFYNLIGEKLSYLAEQITNSYILLTIIGIFILIFVFELIYRRYL